MTAPYKAHNEALLRRLRSKLGKLPRGWRVMFRWDYEVLKGLPMLFVSASRTVKRKRCLSVSGTLFDGDRDWTIHVSHVEVAADPSHHLGEIEMYGPGSSMAVELARLASVVKRIAALRYPATAPLPGPRQLRPANPIGGCRKAS